MNTTTIPVNGLANANFDVTECHKMHETVLLSERAKGHGCSLTVTATSKSFEKLATECKKIGLKENLAKTV